MAMPMLIPLSNLSMIHDRPLILMDLYLCTHMFDVPDT
jgi:hypothetical protein